MEEWEIKISKYTASTDVVILYHHSTCKPIFFCQNIYLQSRMLERRKEETIECECSTVVPQTIIFQVNMLL